MSVSNKDEMTTEERLSRLHLLFDENDAWQKPDPQVTPFLAPQPPEETYCSSDPEDDEQVRSYHHRVGVALQKPIGPGDVISETETVYPSYKLEVGEEGPEGERFCSFKALMQYPRNYISLAERNEIVRKFFDKGKIYENCWDYFYIYPPRELSHNPILLVSLSQVERFLRLINTEQRTHLEIPQHTGTVGLIMDFPSDGTPRPRYLGRSTEREMAEIVKRSVPSFSYRPENEPDIVSMPTDLSLKAFKNKIALLLENEIQKKAFNKEKKKKERFQRQQSWNHGLKRVQRYLGLREGCYVHKEIQDDLQTSELQWPDYDEGVKASEEKIASSLAFENRFPAPFVQEGSVVFVSVDVEAYERDHNNVTEIGIATLDTADIASTSPGEGAKNWMTAIRARHFRVKEYGHLRNKEFVEGCPDKFLFGNSEWVSKNEAATEVAKCFRHPFSQPNTKYDPALPKRNIIFVGHGVKGDINYLRQIGYDPHNLPNLQELVDTCSIYQAFRREKNPRNLGSILADLNIAGWFLHNAGNDAVYTLQAMLAISVHALAQKQDRDIKAEALKTKIVEATKEAAENEWDQAQGWSSGGENSDGGAPVLIMTEAPAQKSAAPKNSNLPVKGGKTPSHTPPASLYDYVKTNPRNRPWRAAKGETSEQSKQSETNDANIWKPKPEEMRTGNDEW